jgi:hypothetical protein
MWIGVCGLIALGLIFGQPMPVAIAAMVGAYIAYEAAQTHA